MNLNNLQAFKAIDTEDMLSHIDGLPVQLEKAWELGKQLPLPEWSGVRQVIIAGMGGSAIGADLLAAYCEPLCRVPILVHRDYNLPAWARGPETLCIASSHSGNTEETLSAYEQAVEADCRILAICTGGKLAAAAQNTGAALWRFEHHGQPRAAVGYSFGLLLAVFARLGLIPDPENELREAVAAMQQQQENLGAEVVAAKNPAKRMAGQLLNRWVTVFGAGLLAPVARRWKGQISEVAKAWGQFEFLPEANHNTLAGIENPENILPQMMVIFLQSPSDHPRNQLRSDLTRQILLLQGIATDFIHAQGETRLAHLWATLHLGDYVAYYLAMAYGVDPTPVEMIEGLKHEMKARS